MNESTYADSRTVCVVIPALNEADSIEQVIRTIPVVELEKIGYRTNVLVVDNGSDDGTGEIAAKAGAAVVCEPHRGYGMTYLRGFANARGDVIATMDADMTYPAHDIPRLVKLLDDGVDFITTNRFALIDKNAMSLTNRLGNSVLTQAMNLLFGMRIKDSQSGMWVFRQELLERMKLRSGTMALSEEIKIEAVSKLKCRWREEPIHYSARIGEVKLNRWRDGFWNLWYLVKKRLRR